MTRTPILTSPFKHLPKREVVDPGFDLTGFPPATPAELSAAAKRSPEANCAVALYLYDREHMNNWLVMVMFSALTMVTADAYKRKKWTAFLNYLIAVDADENDPTPPMTGPTPGEA